MGGDTFNKVACTQRRYGQPDPVLAGGDVNIYITFTIPRVSSKFVFRLYGDFFRLCVFRHCRT